MLAGASMGVAGRLGLAMLAMQVAIGALNDWADQARDAVTKPAKPIPSGLATSTQALALAGAGGVGTLALSAMSGVPTLLVAALALGLGFLYDLRLSRTIWSWLPLALALPLLPIHAWLGATGTVPTGLLGLLPIGVLAGAALALANGLVDVERDALSNRPGAVVRLGPARAWALHALLLAFVSVLAVLLAPAFPPGDGGRPGAGTLVPPEVLGALRTWGVNAGLAALAVGAVALRGARPGVRERGWELEAVGVAAVGLGWIAGTAASGGG